MGEGGMHSEATYIGCRQGEVSQWVALRPIFEVCASSRIIRGRAPEEFVVVTRGAVHNFQGNIGGYLAGGADKAEQE